VTGNPPGLAATPPASRAGLESFARQLSRPGRWHSLAAVRRLMRLRELGRDGFLAELDRLTDIYAAAMRPDPAQLPGRRDIMERHSGYQGFRALAMLAGPAGDGALAGDGRGGSANGGPAEADGDRMIAFTYGFRGGRGQWWHDVVRTALMARAGETVAAAWLDDSMEVAELHVRPEFQHRGVGRKLLLSLVDGRTEHTAALSTPDTNQPALRLYRGVGFTSLLSGFMFPGGGPAYTVLGAPLPLAPEQTARNQPRP
jgi:GNAT superfamily N-acetyltransferase